MSNWFKNIIKRLRPSGGIGNGNESQGLSGGTGNERNRGNQQKAEEVRPPFFILILFVALFSSPFMLNLWNSSSKNINVQDSLLYLSAGMLIIVTMASIFFIYRTLQIKTEKNRKVETNRQSSLLLEQANKLLTSNLLKSNADPMVKKETVHLLRTYIATSNKLHNVSNDYLNQDDPGFDIDDLIKRMPQGK